MQNSDMTTTCEQLELAAKAMGLSIGWSSSAQAFFVNGQFDGDVWSPLTDRGQLLGLALACGISILQEDIGYVIDDGPIMFKRYWPQTFERAAEAIIAAAPQQLAKERAQCIL
jgi:hypothetical protein